MVRRVFVPELDFVAVGITDESKRLVVAEIASAQYPATCRNDPVESFIQAIRPRQSQPKMNDAARLASALRHEFEGNHIRGARADHLGRAGVPNVLFCAESGLVESDCPIEVGDLESNVRKAECRWSHESPGTPPPRRDKGQATRIVVQGGAAQPVREL